MSGRNPQIDLSRRYDVDWLRVLGMMTVFLFHNNRFFDTEGWHVKSAETSQVSTVITTFAVQWMMPLFFILSGIGTYHALARARWPQYLMSRVKRLLVPLLSGIFVIIAPWQVYLERISHGQFSGSFWQFYWHGYFDGWYGFGGNFAWMGIHLWYLEVLFCFSLITLPLFLFLQSRFAARRMAGLLRFLKAPGAIFLLAVPIAIMAIVANAMPTGSLFNQRGFGGWSVLPYVAVFITGFVLAAGKEMGKTMEIHRLAGLAIGAATFVVGYIWVKYYHLPEGSVAFAVLRGLLCWAFLVAICGFANRHLRFSSAFLKYANEAVMPFYILHQTVILTIGFHIVRLHTHLWLEYLIIATSSFAVIMTLYELAIRRINVLRVLCGMKAVQRVRPAPAREPLPSAK
ncbi:MAG: acyltransferase family protein [Sedimentisphaerales bacterium]|nr:acyltransferase family protein [Sedimentisphaerales bacterium]